MNRLKRELRKKGVKLECDYPFLPYYIKGKAFDVGHIAIEGVRVVSETAEVFEYYNVIVDHRRLNRSGILEEVCEFEMNKQKCKAFWADVRGSFGFTGKGTVGIMSTNHIAERIGISTTETEKWLRKCAEYGITERQGGGWVI